MTTRFIDDLSIIEDMFTYIFMFHIKPYIYPKGVLILSPIHLQVRSNYRTAVTIPERSWGRFRDMLSEFADGSSQSGTVAETQKETK